MSETLVEWLIGERTRGITNVHFAFGTPLGLWLSLALLGVVGYVVARLYPARLSGMPAGPRRLVTALRTFVVVFTLFLVLDPGFQGVRFEPHRNFTLLMFDDSASMGITTEGTTRGARLKQAYQAALKDFEEPLSQRYQLARYAIGESTQRIRDLSSLQFKQSETHIQAAIQTARADFQGIGVNGIVVFSDGVEQPAQPKIQPDTRVPVFTVGVGVPDSFRDLELTGITHSRSHGDGAPVRVKVAISAIGMAGSKVIVEVKREGQLLTTATQILASNDEQHEVRLEFKPQQPGWQAYQVSLRPASHGVGITPIDEVPANNSRLILVDNRKQERRVFYFSGRPNWENKFVTTALKSDTEIDLTSVLRISAAETKFVYRGKQSSMKNPLFEGFYKDDLDQPRYDESVYLRFGGDRSLAGKGFPEYSEEIFAYDLLIIGEVEANYFDQKQLELTREFVRKRGGSLLMLGGPHSFTEGKYQETVLAGILPVRLNQSEHQQMTATTSFKAKPSLEGTLAGSWVLHPNPEQNRALWADLPALDGLNSFPMVRPHATTHARAETETPELDDSPLFAVQRYGSGHTAILATGATWQWQLGTAAKDERHGRIWRQLVRGLTARVERPILQRKKQDHYIVAKEVSLEYLVRDKNYDERTGLATRLEITHPDGRITTVGVEETIEEAGVYKAAFTPASQGLYRMKLTAQDESQREVGQLEEAILVIEDQREYRQARGNTAYLKELAAATGGAYFDLEELATVAARIPFVPHQEAEQIHLSFWHFPPFFLILVGVMSLEWYLRRKRGHA